MSSRNVSTEQWKDTFVNGILYGAFCAFVIVASIILIGRIRRFHIQEYRVDGAYYVSADEIERATRRYIAESTCLRLVSCDHVWYWPGASLRSYLIARFPRVSAIQYRWEKTTVIIEITERSHSAIGCDTDQKKECWFMDEDGVVFARAPVFSRGIYQEFTVVPPKVLPARALPSWLPTAITELENRTHIRLTEIRMSKKAIAGRVIRISDRDFDSDAPELLFDIADIHTKESLDYLARVIERLFAMDAFQKQLTSGQKLEYIDLRFDGKVFYKFSS